MASAPNAARAMRGIALHETLARSAPVVGRHPT